MTAEGWKCLESSLCFQRFESFDLVQDRLCEAVERLERLEQMYLTPYRSWDRQRREAQPFHSEVDGFLPLSRHRSAVLRGETKPHSNDVREHKMTLKIHSRTPFALLQDCTSLPAFSV